MTTTIPTLPEAPRRENPQPDFEIISDNFVAAMDPWGQAVQAVGEEAEAAATAAEAAAASAYAAPGTNATSSTSVTIGTGSKAFGIQTGKVIVKGMFVSIASDASPLNWMHGFVTAYNSGTGALTVQVTGTNGSGTFADWIIAISAPADFSAATAAQIWAASSDVVAVTPYGLGAATAFVPIAFGATIALNGALGRKFSVGDVTSNFTMARPTNLIPGQGGMMRFRIGGSGGYVGGWGPGWDFTNKLVPVFSTLVGAIDELIWEAISATEATAYLRKNVGS